MSAVAKRYARAAVEAATQGEGQTGVNALADGIRAFRDAVRVSPELREALANPQLKDSRTAVLNAVAQKLGLNRWALELVRVLSTNDRLDELDEVASQVEALADEQAGRLRAQVVSAIPLTEVQTQRVAKALTHRMGRPVVVGVQVDPEILGGLVCRIGDLTLDSSVRRQLDSMRERLEVSVH